MADDVERPALVWERGREAALEFGIWPERPVTVGRETTNTIVIDSPFVSKAHAILQYRSGRYVLEDLGSANGTRVNGQAIESATLQPGDVVEIGDQRLVFISRSAAPTMGSGLSKGTKLALAAGGTATVMIVGLGLLVTSIQPSSPAGAPESTRAVGASSSGVTPSALPKTVTASGIVAEVVARARKAGIEPVDAMFDEALLQYRVGRLRETRELLAEIVAVQPGHELAANRLRAVEDLLSQAITRFSGEGDRAYAQLRYDDAITAWEQVLLLAEPGDPRYGAAQAGLTRARARMSR